jgi:hypothetical protein|tara:strand:- start:698 stop:970 length:273 start_codon:yes stop_codon:yes gene_type:complete
LFAEGDFELLVESEEELEEDDSDEELVEEAADSDEEEDCSAAATFFFFPDLKSVSYQPLPFNLNPAADTFLRRASSAHSGHVLNCASLSF